jgi:hypothetical protein
MKIIPWMGDQCCVLNISGDVLVVERPYASVMDPDFWESHCLNCYKRVKLIVPCPNCCSVCIDKKLLSRSKLLQRFINQIDLFCFRLSSVQKTAAMLQQSSTTK